MEAHAACEGFISTRWRRVLEWFWATVGRMEQLELSQLPRRLSLALSGSGTRRTRAPPVKQLT